MRLRQAGAAAGAARRRALLLALAQLASLVAAQQGSDNDDGAARPRAVISVFVGMVILACCFVWPCLFACSLCSRPAQCFQGSLRKCLFMDSGEPREHKLNFTIMCVALLAAIAGWTLASAFFAYYSLWGQAAFAWVVLLFMSCTCWRIFTRWACETGYLERGIPGVSEAEWAQVLSSATERKIRRELRKSGLPDVPPRYEDSAKDVVMDPAPLEPPPPYQQRV